jgi:hypothetical protein
MDTLPAASSQMRILQTAKQAAKWAGRQDIIAMQPTQPKECAVNNLQTPVVIAGCRRAATSCRKTSAR